MVQKISGIKVESTPDQDKLVWAAIFSHRNKLLLNSDWTQLVDSGLTPACVQKWRDWRRQLKNLNRANFSDSSLVEKHIAKLAKKIPYNEYITEDSSGPDVERYNSVAEFRLAVLGYLDDNFNRLCNSGSFLRNPLLLAAQTQEAHAYLSNDGIGDYPLIATHAAFTGLGEAVVVYEFLAAESNAAVRIANLFEQYYTFMSLAKEAVDEVELTNLQADINTWILIST